jgi:hypothetical protein
VHRIATTLLDLAGLLLIAAGAYFLAEPHMGRASLLVAGGVLLAGSHLAARAADPRPVAAWWPRLVARLRREGAT